MKTFLIILITAVVIGGLTATAFIKYHGRNEGMQALSVRIETAKIGDLIETVSAPGQVEPKTKVSISAKVSARITELPLKEGDKVSKGDPNAKPEIQPTMLLKLDSKDLEAQLRQAEAHYAAQAAQLTVAEARILAQEATIQAARVLLADAERDLKRQIELLSTKDVSQSIVDAAQSKFDQQSAQIDSAKRSVDADRQNLQVMKHELDAADAQIAQARDELSYTTINSPIDGVVTRVNSQVGELVVIGTMNNPGTVIMEVANLDTMLVETRIDEASVAAVKLGQKAQVRSQAYANEVFEGVVSAVALAETEEKDGSKYFKTEITLKSDGRRVLSGLTADVDIETDRHQNVVKIPSQAVLGRPVDELPMALRTNPAVDTNKTLATVVFRMVNGKSVVTPVKVGASDVTQTIIESGLNAGDQVVVGPYKVLETLQNDQLLKDEATSPTTQPSATASAPPAKK